MQNDISMLNTILTLRFVVFAMLCVLHTQTDFNSTFLVWYTQLRKFVVFLHDWILDNLWWLKLKADESLGQIGKASECVRLTVNTAELSKLCVHYVICFRILKNDNKRQRSIETEKKNGRNIKVTNCVDLPELHAMMKWVRDLMCWIVTFGDLSRFRVVFFPPPLHTHYAIGVCYVSTYCTSPMCHLGVIKVWIKQNKSIRKQICKRTLIK